MLLIQFVERNCRTGVYEKFNVFQIPLGVHPSVYRGRGSIYKPRQRGNALAIITSGSLNKKLELGYASF